MFLLKSLGGLATALLLFETQTIAGLSPGVTALSVAMFLFVITAVGTANAFGLCHLNRTPI